MSTRRPRYRYVAFRLEGATLPAVEELQDAFRALPGRPVLVAYRAPEGLVRCLHLRKEDTIAALRRIERIAGRSVRVVTLGTSGTIRRATMKYLGRGTRDSTSALRKKPYK